MAHTRAMLAKIAIVTIRLVTTIALGSIHETEKICLMTFPMKNKRRGSICICFCHSWGWKKIAK